MSTASEGIRGLSSTLFAKEGGDCSALDYVPNLSTLATRALVSDPGRIVDTFSLGFFHLLRGSDDFQFKPFITLFNALNWGVKIREEEVAFSDGKLLCHKIIFTKEFKHNEALMILTQLIAERCEEVIYEIHSPQVNLKRLIPHYVAISYSILAFDEDLLALFEKPNPKLRSIHFECQERLDKTTEEDSHFFSDEMLLHIARMAPQVESLSGFKVRGYPETVLNKMRELCPRLCRLEFDGQRYNVFMQTAAFFDLALHAPPTTDAAKCIHFGLRWRTQNPNFKFKYRWFAEGDAEPLHFEIADDHLRVENLPSFDLLFMNFSQDYPQLATGIRKLTIKSPMMNNDNGSLHYISAQFPNLISIELDGGRHHNASLLQLGRTYPGLKVLKLRNNPNLTQEVLQFVIGICPELELLAISGITPIDGLFNPLIGCAALQSLVLTDVKIYEEQPLLEFVRRHETLYIFGLRTTKPFEKCLENGDALVNALAERHRRIQGVNLSGCKTLSAGAMQTLLNECRFLQALHLSFLGLGDETLRAIADTQGHLERLSLPLNCTLNGLTEILDRCRNLQEVFVPRNSKEFPLSTLKKLRESYPKVLINLHQKGWQS